MRDTTPNHESAPTPVGGRAPIAARYDILEELGRGGMGVVYRAHHRHLDKMVAVKVIKPGVDGARFMREARLLAKVTSPYVVGVHDFDILADGSPMLVMELLSGSDLNQRIEQQGGPLDETATLEWMRQTASGLLAAEQQGIVHRDVKPSNIYINDQQQARVMDFGLSRLDGDGSLTIGDSWVGTPLYMAPEQAENPRGVDTRADIYSFGATFYHALTGHPPFPGETSFQILFKHKTEEIIPPIALNPHLTTVTCEFLQRCLAKNPADRFDSFQSVLRFLSPDGQSSPRSGAASNADIADHLKRYQKARRNYLRRSLPLGFSDTYLFPGQRELQIAVDDVTRQHVGAIVCPDHCLLTMDLGSAWTIGEAAGEEVRKLARELAPVSLGRIVVTPGGNLRARFIFHAAAFAFGMERPRSSPRELLSELVDAALYHAKSLDVRTMAIPCVRYDLTGLSQEMMLDTLFASIARALAHGNTCLQQVRLVLHVDSPRDSDYFETPDTITWTCPISRRDASL